MAEGHADAIWAHTVINHPAAAPATFPEGNDLIDDYIFFAQNRSEDIARVRAEGFEVDDDKNPAPENIPDDSDEPPVAVNGGLFEGLSPR